jgi:predicted nuclease of predicted toxin-antitoxin system
MRILIDECIDERFRNYFPGHDCQTARYAGLAGLTNGELLMAAETAQFDVLSTTDQGIEYQQNLAGRNLAIIIFPYEIEPLKRSLAARAGLPRTHRIHSTWSDRENRRF